MVARPKLILYAQRLKDCSCYRHIFDIEFEVDPTDSRSKFLRKTHQLAADAAVVCFCSARPQDAEELVELSALAGPLPIVACSQTVDPEFVRVGAAQGGVDRFLLCTMDGEKIRQLTFEAIRGGGLKQFLHTCYPDSIASSPTVRKMVDEIVHAFPHRLRAIELAQRLGISRRWLHHICQQAFGVPFSRLMRRIWVHQALGMMRRTKLDNGEMALQLNYSEESNLARDFHKELGYHPNEARRRLIDHMPESLLLK